MLRSHAVWMFVVSVFAAPAATGMAQDARQSPLQAATESAADKPVTIAGPTAPAPHIDPEFERVLSMLTGSFRVAPSGEDPALRLNAARIKVEGLDNAVYFEIAREDSPAEPFRQGVFHLYRRGTELRLRVMDFRASPDFTEMLAGLWAAPESIPTLDARRLAANLDLVLAAEGGRVLGRTPHPYPTVDRGAVEMTSSIQLTSRFVALHDTGIAADGREIWSTGSATNPVRFERQESPWFKADRRDDGLIVITLRPPEESAEGLAEGGETALHFSSWLTDGSRINTSRAEGRDAVRVRHPTQPKGLSDALVGIAVGERRKVVIPPALAYGEQGARNVIPPNATLIFETECMWVDNSNPQPAVPPMLPGHGR
ncbi:MAG: FKBP-type peptidyl-prolyl cis-trans isomerase [Phycisphaeraceae bacterium]|nr:FKBP-type peptidyl-prolyl cis-trans isomerase [Phycisphaeraceae bacterium]